jgi:hypothetical protein
MTNFSKRNGPLSRNVAAVWRGIVQLGLCLAFLLVAPQIAHAENSMTTEANDLCNELIARSQAHDAAAQVRVADTWNQQLSADRSNPTKNLHNKISSERCLDRHFTFLETIRDLLNGLKGLITSIVNYLKSLLNQVCQFVATTINNVLSSVCIPVPKLSLSLSLSSLSASSKSCDGLSLSNVLKIDSNTSGSSSLAVKAVNPPSKFKYPAVRTPSSN